MDNTKLVDQEALDLMPSGKVRNYIFKGDDFLIIPFFVFILTLVLSH